MAESGGSGGRGGRRERRVAGAERAGAEMSGNGGSGREKEGEGMMSARSVKAGMISSFVGSSIFSFEPSMSCTYPVRCIL